MTEQTDFGGEWVKRPRWRVSHFALAGTTTVWAMGAQQLTACGKHIAVDEDLEPEPTGIDTADRCPRCRAKTGSEA
jgi:hypothetical protein